MKTFEELLFSLLQEVEQNPHADIDSLLVSKAREYGLSDEEIKEIIDSNAMVEHIESVAVDMQEARKQGATRQEFLAETLGVVHESDNENELK